MDELKTRLEFLERLSQSASDEPDFQSQVDELEAALNTLVDKHQEMKQLAEEATSKRLWTEIEATDDAIDVPDDVKQEVVQSRAKEIMRFTETLETQPSFDIPPVEGSPLLENVPEVWRDFDEVSLRSAMAARAWLDRVAKYNSYPRR